jgi:transcriptional regulator with XRE-family HTH domain
MAGSVFTKAHASLIVSLVAARKAAGLTQVQLAERLQKPQSFVSKIEQGQRRVDVLEFCAIAHAVGESPEHLLENVLARLPAPLKF